MSIGGVTDESGEKVAFGVKEGCTYLGISHPTFYRLMNKGDIPSFRIGRRRLVLKKHLDQFLQNCIDAEGHV